MAFLGGSALASSVLFGILPALQASRSTFSGDEGRRTRTSTPQAQRAQQTLVVVQYALALVLIITSLLLLRSFARLVSIDPGFDGRNLLTVRLWMPQPNDPATGPYFKLDQRSAFFRRLLERVESLPGVTAAAVINALPLADRRAQQSGLVRGLLYGLAPTDVVTWIAAPILLALVSLAACLGPAWRASRTDPAATLRAET